MSVFIEGRSMLKHFVFAREDHPGEAWRARFAAGRAESCRWYLGQDPGDLPSAAECRAALVRHMPELVAHYDRACALIGDDALGHRVLSHFRPAPLVHGCSQVVWRGAGGPALVRNYDFPLDLVSDRFESTSWSGREVIAKAQRPWGGCLDGMNADGLVASLTAGGGRARGRGFAVILMLRHVLETCGTVAAAVARLRTIPIALSQNVTLLDRTGDWATLFLGPDRAAALSRDPVCVNHQDAIPDRPSEAMMHSIERHAVLSAALADSAMTLEALVGRFLAPPIYSRRPGFTTAYTAVYRPAQGRVDYLWPGRSVVQRIGGFTEARYTHDYGEPAA